MLDFISDISLFKSDAEKAVDSLYGSNKVYSPIPEVDQTAGGRPIRSPLSEASTPSYLEQAQTGLSDLWNRTELLISPESTGEALVNQIYGYDEAGNPLTPANQTISYDPESLATPNIVTKSVNAVKRAASTVVDSVQGAFLKYGIIAFIALLAVVLVYGAASSYGGRRR